MITIEKELETKGKEFNRIIDQLQERMKKYPKGSLRVAQNKDGNAYYHCYDAIEDGKCKRNAVYIRKQDMSLAKALAQKSYDKKVLRWAAQCHEHLNALLEIYQDHALDKFYEEMSEARKQLVTPIEESRQGMLARWNQMQYEGKGFAEDAPQIFTEKGERVRSKSEKILADKFLMKGIPYKYECPLKLNGYGTIYPDFTLLNVHSGALYYWEHFGMMDNAEYVEKAMKKIETYAQNGVFAGKQLLLTFETKKNGLNIHTVEALLQEYFPL